MSSLIRSLAVSVLSRYLGEYVVGLEAQNMEISISSGDACLEKLELRASALDSLDLPITVRAGYLEKVKINIPWTAIRSQPASVEISGLYLLAGPRDSEFDLQAELKRAQSNKQKRLVLAEMFRGSSRNDDSSAAASAAAAAAAAAANKKDDGFTARLVALVLNNLQVRVKNVHIRYEDALTNPERPFVCGITLESFSGVTVDEHGTAAFVVEPTGFIHKLVELRNFAVYWDSQGQHVQFNPGEEMRVAMNLLIWKDQQEQEPNLSYLLKPVSGKLELAMLRDSFVTDFSKPQYLFTFLFENIGVSLQESQYRDFASLAEGFRLQTLRLPYMDLQRPRERPTARPREWWQYGVRAVLKNLKETRAQWSWQRILERKRDRTRYILLYADYKRAASAAAASGSAAPLQVAELVALEEKLSYEDILMYRSLCEALLRRQPESESAVASAVVAASSPSRVSATKDDEEAPSPSKSSSYLGWMVGWAYSSNVATEEASGAEAREEAWEGAQQRASSSPSKAADNLWNSGASERVLTARLMSELYAAVEKDESSESGRNAGEALLPQEYVRRKIVFRLQQGALSLIEGDKKLLSTLIFANVECRLDSCVDSHVLSANLESIKLFHGSTPIISSVGSTSPSGVLPVVKFTVEVRNSHAANAKNDFVFNMHIRPMSFLFSRPFTESLVHFFVRGKGSAWRDIQDFTGATAQIEALQRQATNQLREVIENRRSVVLALQVDSPQFFVPEDISRPTCSVLTVQMESLCLSTVVCDRIPAELVTAERVNETPDLFYDRFTLSLMCVHIALARPKSEWRWDAFAECCGPNPTSLIEPCGLEFSLLHCLVDVPFLPAVKLSASIPNVRAFLSAKNFLSFVTCLRTIVSDDEDDLFVDPDMVDENAIVPFGDDEIFSLAEPSAIVVDQEQARKLQVSLTIEKASVLLHHDKTDQDLAELNFSDFKIVVAKLPKEMHFSVWLRDLYLIDLVKAPDSTARYLMSSVSDGDPAVGSSEHHLVTLRFASTHRDASSFDGVDYDLDLHMKQLFCICNRGSVANLIDLGNDILDGISQTAPIRRVSPPAASAAAGAAAGGSKSLPVSLQKSSAGLFLKVRFRMDSLRIRFVLENDVAFAQAHILRWDQAMRFCNNDTWVLDIRVGSTVLEDLRPASSRWSKVLQLDGNDTLRFSFETFAPSDLTSTQRLLACHPGHVSRGYNMLLSVHVESMRYVYVQNFVTEWVRYFVEIHSMQQMVAASYARAAGLAVNTASTEQLMCFKVTLRNPLILVPRSYDSDSYTLLDLGNVQVGNLFCTDSKRFLFGRTEYEMASMRIALFPRGGLGEGEKLLSDLTVKLAKEELEDAAKDSGPDFPAVKWSMECSPIKVVMSEVQANLLFATVRENLVADLQKEETRAAYKDFQFTQYIISEEAPLRSASASSSSSVIEEAAAAAAAAAAAVAADVDPPLAFSPFPVRLIDLTLARIEIDLLQGDGVAVAADGTRCATSMMNFDMTHLVVHMMTDSAGYSLSEYDMESVNLFDVRFAAKNRFSRLLSSNTASKSKQELHLTQVNYVSGDKEFMLTVEHPRIVLTPWAYRELWSFVWPLFESALESWDLWLSDGEPPKPPDPNKAVDWTFRVTVTDPEIVLVTDASQASCEALVLKGALLFKHYEPASGGQIRSLHFRQLEAFRCLLLAGQNDDLAEDPTMVSMVEPTDITIFHEWMPSKQREKWAVEVEPMNFTVSYHDFRMLSVLYYYWWPEEAAAAGGKTIVEPLLSDVLESDKSEEGVAVAVASVDSGRADVPPASSAAAPPPQTVVQTIYKLSTHGTLLRLVNDFYAGNVPVALISMPSVVMRISQTEEATKFFSSVTFLAEVYNDDAQAWEPVIEPFSAEIAYSRSNSSGVRASVTADAVLDVNLTEGAIDMLMRTWRDLSADYYSRGSATVATETFRVLGAMYVVRNDTGTPVWVWRVDEESAVVEAPIHGYEVPLPEATKNRQALLYQSRYRNMDKRAPASICIKVAGDLRIARGYPIHEVGCHVLRVDPDEKIKLILQISNQKGGKLLQVRTNVRFCNATDVPLELEGQCSHVGSVVLTVLQPGGVYALPLAFLRNGKVRVRPAGKPYEWSGQSITVSTIRTTSALMLCPPSDKTIMRADFALFCVMDPQIEDPGALLAPAEDEHAITFCAPVIVENLLGVPCVFRLISAETDKVLLQGQLGKGDVARVNLDVRKRMLLSVRLSDYQWSAPRGILGIRAANTIELLDSSGLPLTLDLHYVKFASGLTKISIFTQFWIVNTTGIPLVHSQYSMQSRVVVAGQSASIRAIRNEEAEDASSHVAATSSASDVPRSTATLPGDLGGDAIELPPARQQQQEAHGARSFPVELFRPLMYFPEKSGRKMSFRGLFTHWSAPFTVGAAGTFEIVDLPQIKRRVPDGSKKARGGLFQFVVSVEREPGKFWRTRSITIKPRIVLVNHTKTPLLFAQNQMQKQRQVKLEVDEQAPFHWTSAKREKNLTVCLAAEGWNWSPGFSLVANHKTTIKARNLKGQSALLKVRVIESDNTLVVVFDEENPEFPTYRIHNASSEPVLIHQYLAVPHIYETVPAGASVAYAWDDPNLTPLLLEVVSASNEEKILLDLDNLGLFNTSNPAEMLVLSPLEGLGHFYGVVTAEGPSKVATIKLNESARPHSHRLSELAAQRKQKFTAHLSLRGIGVSVVNRMPLELVYVSMSDISMDYEDNMREQCFDFSIGHLQVDNQSFMTQFPVLLHTRPKREKFLSVSLKRSADYASVHYIKRLSLFVDDMDVCMDDSVFLKMWDFVANVARSLDMETSSSPDVSAAAASVGVSSSLTPQFAIPTHNFKSRQIYLQELTLSGTNLLVSFINTDDTADGQLGETAVSRIIRTYGALANIERAPVKLEPLVLSLQFLGREDLMDTLKTHYVTGVRRGLAKILASADFLGAPMALAGHVREGARDLVEMPRKGAAADGARGAIAGVGKGTASLAKSVGYGAFNSLHKITGTIGDGVSALALDEHYERERAQLGRQRAEHAGQGFAYGARDLGLGLVRGISGVVLEPVRGAREDGVRGFFTGISRGITGLYVKPAVGVVDLVTRSAEGLKNTTTYWEEGSKKRVRLPRFIGGDGVMHVFQRHQAAGQFLLYTLAGGRHFADRREFYKAHFEIGVKTTLIVTNLSLIQCTDGKEDFSLAIGNIEKIGADSKVFADGLLVFVKEEKNPRRLNCVFNNQNFAGELLKLLTALLQHEVESIGRVEGSPRAPRRRSLPGARRRYDQFLSSDDEGYATLDEKTAARSSSPHNNNNE